MMDAQRSAIRLIPGGEKDKSVNRFEMIPEMSRERKREREQERGKGDLQTEMAFLPWKMESLRVVWRS